MVWLLNAGFSKSQLEVTWNNRQFYIPYFVRMRVENGATRNLVIFKVHSNITESSIRQDLEHIHNLVVIDVKFKDGNAYIFTNSVHNALFARSCMASRVKYRGMKIGFFADECAAPLSRVSRHWKGQSPGLVTSAPTASAHNRFELLSLDTLA